MVLITPVPRLLDTLALWCIVFTLCITGQQNVNAKTWNLVAQEGLNASTWGFLINEGITASAAAPDILILTGQQTLLRVQVAPKVQTTATSLSHNLQLQSRNLSPIPQHFLTVPPLLYNHLGDPCIWNDGGGGSGQLLIPVENVHHRNGSVFVYNADTLDFENAWFTPQQHMPWLAVDSTRNILYSSEFSNVTHIRRYALPAVHGALVPLSPLVLDTTLQSMQGCDFDTTKEGGAETEVLYCTQNPPQPAVVAVNTTTGTVTSVIGPIYPELEGILFHDLRAFGLGTLHVMNGHPWGPTCSYSTLYHYE